jgi:hypothetical protein
MKSIFEPAGGRASPAVVETPSRAVRQTVRTARPAVSMKQSAAKQSVSPVRPAPMARVPQPPDSEFCAWLEELL